MTDLRDLSNSLADASKILHTPTTHGGLERTLETIEDAARHCVPGFDHVGVTVVQGDGAPTTMASTGDLVLEWDNLQYEFDQGPCMDALRRERLVLVEHLEQQAHNWPRYAPRASEAGVRAQMGVQLQRSGTTLGSLNFYSMAAQTVDPEAPRRAELFATHAAIALAYARHIEDLTHAHEPIGQAVGILMERFEINEEQAMYYLVRVATAAELQLREVAGEVVEEVNRRTLRSESPMMQNELTS
jgi:transcriptional regulator with GAF, ATPase, and Fis domain